METCGLPSIRGNVTNLYNVVCIAQIKEWRIKGDNIKHISPNFFLNIHQLQKSDQNVVQRVRSSDNLVDLFTKTLSATILKKLIGIHQLKDLHATLLERI